MTMIGQNTYTIYVDTKLRDNRPVRIRIKSLLRTVTLRISVLTYIYNHWNAVRVVAGGVRQDEIGRLRSPAIIIHDSHFAIAAVYVVFVERLRRR